MRRLLYILTRADDPLAIEVLEAEKRNRDCEVRVFDLSDDRADYAQLLEEIFAADSVQVW